MALNTRDFVARAIRRISKTVQGVGELFERNQKKAYIWLMDKVDRLKDPLINEDASPFDFMIKYPGTFYMFRYDSKLYNQGKLKFFDAYPLVFIFEIDNKGFTGINFHYILPKFRALILSHLISTYGMKWFNDRRLVPVNWNMVVSSLGSVKRHIRVAVKRYLWENVLKIRGVQAIRIENTDMENSMYFTSADWVNSTEHQVRAYIKKHTQ
jgi:hypothetical protein